jgi:sugar lactone lactonase YvrE
MEAKVKKARGKASVAIILGAVAVAAVSAAACSEEKAAGAGSDKPPPSIGAVANDPTAQSPVDATPSPDGKDIYFIANGKVADEDNIGSVQTPGIYKVSAVGGAVTKLAQGAPLVAPFGITISDDGQTLFIADSGADTSEDRSDGKVFTMGVSGGTPSALAGTDGLAPGGVEVAGDSLYITGRRDGKAGLFKTGLGGGAIVPVAVGDAFSDPGGVAVTKNGDAYVVDTGSVTHGQSLASVVKVGADGHTEVVVDGLSVGHPAGIALTRDDALLYVSGFDQGKGTDVVYAVDTVSKLVGLFTDSIGEFSDSAGLHRARNSDVFAWADGHANATGTVYVLRGQ